MQKGALKSFRYEIDQRDTITRVSPEWDRFARDNRSPDLHEQAVVGRSLWDFIAGPEVRELYRQILARVRNNDTPVILPFRCDSPETRRFMRLEMTPLGGGAVRFDGVLVREEARVPLSLLDPELSRGERVLAICSWCKRGRASESEWLEIEDLIVRLDLFARADPPRFTHTACSGCEAQLLEELE